MVFSEFWLALLSERRTVAGRLGVYFITGQSGVYMLSRTLSHALCREAVIGLGILFLTSVSHIIIEQPCWED